MPDRVITAEALITAKDATGDVFTKIAREIQGVGKAAKASLEIDAMTKSMERASAQAKALGKYQTNLQNFEASRTAFNEQKTAVESMARSLRETSAPTKKMQADFAALQASVGKSAASFEKQKAALLGSKHELEAFGMPLGKVEAQQAALRSTIDKTTVAILHQAAAERKAAEDAALLQKKQEAAHKAAERDRERRAEAIAHHGVVNFALGAAAGAVGVHSVIGVGEKAWEAGAERQHVIAGMRSAGIPVEEIERAQSLAMRVSGDAPNLSVSQIMELHKEARSAVQHPDEVFGLMPDLARAASVLKGMGADNANIADLVKGGESLGLMNDPARFHRFLEGQVKAMQVMGKTITTEQIYEAAKYSKSAGATLSDDFLNTTMPSLIQEMHGSSAGDALAALTKRWRGGLAHQHIAVERLNQMGLLDDPSQIKRSKTGEIMGYLGKLKGDELLGSDPAQFFYKVWEPAAQRIGVTTLADKIKLLNETLPSTAANLGRILIQQEETLRQHKQNYENATGLQETVESQKRDWDAATAAFKASLADFGASITGPVLPAAAKGLSWLSGELKSLSGWASSHPMVAVPAAGAVGAAALAGAGFLSYQFLTAGNSLQTAAGLLQDAALRLGANPISKVPPVIGPTGALVPGAETLLGGGALGVGAALTMGATIGGLAWLIKASHEAQRAGNGGAWAPATFATRQADEDALAEQEERLAGLRQMLSERQSKNKLGSFGFDSYDDQAEGMKREIAELENEIAARRNSLARIPQFPIGPGGDLPTMVGGAGVSYGRKGQPTFPSVPWMPAGIPSSALPTMAQIPSLSGGGPIDVTGKVQSESHITTDVNTRFTLNVPPGFSVTKDFESKVTRVDTGPSMPSAGVAPHVSRRDE